MKQPEGFMKEGDKELVCKLEKSPYGLKQSPRCWYEKLRVHLVKDDGVGSKTDKKLFQQIMGSLQYAVSGTRPDIAHALNNVARYSNDPSEVHLTTAKRILQYLKGTQDRPSPTSRVKVMNCWGIMAPIGQETRTAADLLQGSCFC